MLYEIYLNYRNVNLIITLNNTKVRVFNFHRYDNNTKCVNKLNPRRVLYESKGDTIVSLMYAAAEGDMGNLRR